jgi:hypothetical protein
METPMPLVGVAALIAQVRAALADPFEEPGPFAATVARIMHGYPELEDAARRLGEHGWTIPMWAPAQRVAQAVAQGSREAIDGYFLSMYLASDRAREARLLDDVLSAQELEWWRPLLAECVAAYRKGQYRIVVPSLLLILEGAMANAGNRFTKSADPSRIATEARKAADHPRVDWLIWLSIEAFLGRVFVSHSFAADRPQLLNRHWILHGRDVPEWDQTDCLRLFQALDTIGAVLSVSREDAA